MLKTLLQKTALYRALKNQDGVAAIEFAIVAPIMLALYIGLAEVSLLITADRKISHAASVMGDLATQLEVLDEDEVEDVIDATLAALSVDSTEATRVDIDMISVQKESDGSITEVGYAKYGTGWATKYDASGVNAILLNETSGLVIARVKYNYQSPSKTFVKNIVLEETFMLKPRKSSTIPFENGGSSTITCSRTTDNHGRPSASCT